MSEKELSDALLRLDGGLPVLPDVKGLTAQVLNRDRREVRRLHLLTLLVWLVADALVVLVFVEMGLLMPKQAKLRTDLVSDKINAREYILGQTENQVVAQMLTLGVAGSVMMLGIAAFLTLVLVQRSRNATLRQMSASLMEISDQLKQLRQAKT
ncbi:MAG: hypothetical protein U0797_10640 [Gemmataceae bacterium]